MKKRIKANKRKAEELRKSKNKKRSNEGKVAVNPYEGSGVRTKEGISEVSEGGESGEREGRERFGDNDLQAPYTRFVFRPAVVPYSMFKLPPQPIEEPPNLHRHPHQQGSG